MVSKSQRKKKILIADNSVTVQKLVHLTFAEMDFEVITASDGADALSKSKTLLPELVLADCGLDQLDGPALCEEIRSELKLAKCRVVLLKGADDKNFESRIRAAKPDAVLSKPFDAKGLIRMVKDLEQSEEPTVSTAVSMAVSKQLEVIAAEVIGESLAQPEVSEEKKAKEPEETTITLANPDGDFQKIAEVQIRAWIEEHLPAIAERLLKEEISRISGSK